MSNFDSLYDIQRNMANRLSAEMRMNQTLDMLSLIQGLVSDRHGRVQKELVIVEAINSGIGDDEAQALIKELVNQHVLREDGEYLIL